MSPEPSTDKCFLTRVLSQAVDTVASRWLTYFGLFTIQGWLAAAACVLAVAALVRARRASRRLDKLTESYWELRYEYGELRARVARLDPAQGDVDSKEPSPQPAAQNFVPLSSLKR